MEHPIICPQKKPMGSILENLNNKTAITCTKVPDVLFDAKTAEKHFSKFGRVQKIRLLPRKQMCVVEYDQISSAERAVLNAGAFDGFMFDVTRIKQRIRRKSKVDDDPDWLPDEDVEEELSAMSGVPTYRLTRQKPMDTDAPQKVKKDIELPVKKNVLPKKTNVTSTLAQAPVGRESPVAVVSGQTSLSTAEAAEQLHQLRFKISLTPDEKWRTLDARDRILRSWGGAGSRVKIGGATIGTCPDMCPEKELLQRQSEHQVMTLETVVDSDGELEPSRAVKQYSRSSADQEMPMCYELRPPRVLMNTAAYLLRHVADTQRQVTLADWFHFMWDRFRSIRKDITQQASCCADSIRLVEICARFHAHCAARLADLEHTQFDQKLNTDNLTKCLQTLKHMYADVGPHMKPNEAEFRGYIALLNLGDANFWWEVKQLPQEIQKSESITFALNVFSALDNNNYVKFFRLVRHRATYLQACILLRYFNDVRARALARIVKAYAPKGGYLYPAENIMNTLAFESIEAMKSFINHYGLRFAKNVKESILIDRKLFIEDSDPYPISRAINVIESKRYQSVGDVLAGGELPTFDFANHHLHSSFNNDGKLKETALIAEDVEYNTRNDTNADVRMLKTELVNLAKSKSINFKGVDKLNEPQKNVTIKPLFDSTPRKIANFVIKPFNDEDEDKSFSFQLPLLVANSEELKGSKENSFAVKKKSFTFSNPKEMDKNIYSTSSLFTNKTTSNTSESKMVDSNRVFGNLNNIGTDELKNQNLFKKPMSSKSIFALAAENKPETIIVEKGDKNIFASTNNVFSKVSSTALFAKPQGTVENTSNIFTKTQENTTKNPTAIFGSFKGSSVFATPINSDTRGALNSGTNGDTEAKLSPGSLFKSVNQNSSKYTIFQSKNKAPTVADNIFNSINTPNTNIYDFDQSSNDSVKRITYQHKENEEKILLEKAKEEDNENFLQLEKKKEEEKRKQEESKRLEALKKDRERREKERKQEELRKKIEEEREAESKKEAEAKRKTEERQKLFEEKVEKESIELVDELESNITDETLKIILSEEIEIKNKLLLYSEEFLNEICSDIVRDCCQSELKSEVFRTNRIMKKWFHVWKKHFIRNYKRRSILENTPIWLTDRSPQQEAQYLRRLTEKSSLNNMKAIHNGYKFSGEMKDIPPPQRYKMVDVIRSPLLKRFKQIQYPYDKCFFWKLTVISPGSSKWMYKRINIERWITDAFSDKKKYNISDSLLYVGKESWNNLMEFAISISMTSKEKNSYINDALEGSNGLLYYDSDNDNIEILEEIMKCKYLYQVIPIAIIRPENLVQDKRLEEELIKYKNRNIISNYKFFFVDHASLADSMTVVTKRALKWMARNYPNPPSIEIDYLKSICQRYLGNEIWCELKYEHKNTKGLLNLISCYNAAVDKLTEVITNEDLFNYVSFPLEFKQYLNDLSPYPKPYEFITSNVRNSDNVEAIKKIMNRLKLPKPNASSPRSIMNVHEHIQKYCQQIGWFENTEEVVCKVIALLPDEVSNIKMPYEDFSKNYVHYEIIDILNFIVYEKIKDLHNFDNRFAMYLKPTLEDYRNINWSRDVNASSIDKENLAYEDELDFFIEAKRRKIAVNSMQCLMIEDNDCTIVDENIQKADVSINAYGGCKNAVSELEQQLIEEKKKSDALENLLRAALSEEF